MGNGNKEYSTAGDIYLYFCFSLGTEVTHIFQWPPSNAPFSASWTKKWSICGAAVSNCCTVPFTLGGRLGWFRWVWMTLPSQAQSGYDKNNKALSKIRVAAAVAVFAKSC